MGKNRLTATIVMSFIGVILLVPTATSCSFSVTRYAFTLSTDITPSGAGSVTPAWGEYAPGTDVTLTAIPADGYVFDYWSGDTSGNTSTITITMDSDKSLTAHFEATPTNPEILFSDDFSEETTIWDTYSDEIGSCFYENGWLHLVDYTYTNSTADYYLNLIHDYFTDFILEVETKLVGGTDYNLHAVSCRYKDGDNFYECSITADGYYAIRKTVDGNLTYLVDPAYSSYIHQGQDVVNLIHIECIGSTLSLSVNGHLLAEVTDSTFSAGDIGLGAGSYEGTFTEIAFDNIMVVGVQE